MEDEEVRVLINMDLCSAKRLARALRMVGDNTDFTIIDDLAVELGSQLGITSNSDEADELDEMLSPGEEISWDIAIGEENFSDNGDWQHGCVAA